MRKPKYLSPSSFNMYVEDREEFCRRYICDTIPPREAPNQAMLIGSGFDAFVKHALHEIFIGPCDLVELFNSQVSDYHTEIWEIGSNLFNLYKEVGAYDALLQDMEGSTEHGFEVSKNGDNPVPIFGYIDCIYRHRNGKVVILDWKCTNYHAKRVSPLKYYTVEYPSMRSHKGVEPVTEDGILLQRDYCFSLTQPKWATQLAMYELMLGEPCILQIDQVLGKDRVVTYRGGVSEDFKNNIKNNLLSAWDNVSTGHLFPDLEKSESDGIIERLERFNLMKQTNNPLMSVIKGVRSAN